MVLEPDKDSCPCVSVQVQRQEESQRPNLKVIRQRSPSLSAFLFHSGLRLIGRGPPTLGVLLYSDGNLSQKHPEQCWPEYLAPGPSHGDA